MPWHVSFFMNGYATSVSIGKDGKVAVGKKLLEHLNKLNEKIKTYPFEYGFAQEPNKELRLLQASIIGDELAYMEMTPGFIRGFSKGEIKEGSAAHDPVEPPKPILRTVAKPNEDTGPKQPEDKILKEDLREKEGTYMVENSEDYVSNLTDFVKPLDDRFDEIFHYVDDVSYMNDSRVRIGDCLFTIPPLSIGVTKTSNITKVKTLRTKSSVMTKAGSSITQLNMELYFHNLDNINGIPKKTGDLTFHVDGLRSLLAQFSKCPFVPIDNPYINNVLNIHNVALIDLSVSTVPGFPHSLTATITLAKFEIDAFMPGTDFLGDVINYPMMRWYYQQALTERGNGRTYFKPIQGQLTNHFKFKLANRNILEARMQAFSELNSMDTPEKVKQDTKEKKNDYGKMETDAGRADKILEMYEKYKKLGSLKKYAIIENGDVISYVSNAYKKEYKLKSEEYENAVAEGKDAYKSIYREAKHGKKDATFIPYEAPTFYGSRFKPEPNGMGPTGQQAYSNAFNSWPSLPSQYADKVEGFSSKKFGYVHIGLEAAESQKEFPTTYRSGENVDGATGFIIPMTDENVEKLKKIAGQKKTVKQYLEEYEDKYNDLLKIVDSTEADIPMDDVPLEGFLPMSLNVMYSNEFTPLQVLEGDAPALQYVGCQDPYIQIAFEVNDEGLHKLNNLLETADEYARMYRMGITSGYLGIENQMTELFGVQTVMVENTQYTTVPGFPGRNQVQMTLVGFNKTQRRMESLGSFTAGADDEKLEDRVADHGERQKKDDGIIDMRLSKMEVYPDLELPTYGELKEALPKLKIEMEEYPNRTGGLYLDPDFYISTGWTFREDVNKNYLGDHVLEMSDTSGVTMKTSPNSDKAIDGGDDMWSIMENLNEKAPKVDSMFSWGENSQKEGGDYNGDGKTEPVTYKDTKIGEYLTKQQDTGRYAYQDAPSFDKWKEWGYGSTQEQYDKWVQNPNPAEHEVYKVMREQLRKLWTGSIKLSGEDMLKKDPGEKETRVCYNSSESLYAVEYDIIKSNLSAGDRKEVEKRIDAGEFKEVAIDSKKCTKGDYSVFKYKIPEERVFGVIKALFHYSSKWKQFNGKNPRIDAAKNACGIAGVPIADVAANVDEAQRLLWDWKHNIEKGMTHLRDKYKEAADGDRVKKIEFVSRPWDAMVYAYKTGKFPEKEKEMEGNAVVQSVADIFYRYYAKDFCFGTPSAKMNVEVYSYARGMSKKEKDILTGEASKATFIDVLINDLDYEAPKDELKKLSNYDKETGWWASEADLEKLTRQWLEKKEKKEIIKIMKDHIKKFKKEGDVTLGGIAKWFGPLGMLWDWALGKNDIGFDVPFIGTEMTALGDKIMENQTDAQEAVDNAKNNRLVGVDDPKQLYREMYTDLRQSDHRGRMLRAFPAFQMLIIDEGRWMSNYRFWDNLYGFNAIQSIDVYKSRKIAADTAVIQMTNIYSNLTTKRADIKYFDRPAQFWDNLIFEKPTEELLEARKELLKAMMLETGARVHLRMGYGADARALPIVFNGTITEMDTQEVIEIVCQGDGIELGNIVSGDPDDDNNGFFHVTEPRDLICELLTSKGSWFKDMINNLSNGVFMRNNPLGISHFGVPGEMSPMGNVSWFNSNYGEAAQNIYSSNGTASFSQWTHPDGTSRQTANVFSRMFWDNLANTNITRWFQPGDEDNIIVKFYNNTTWDIIQTLTYCSLDYIAAVHPFETRSTLFFGKPYWPMSYCYNSKYEWDESEETWLRKLNSENRKPFMQARMYGSTTDIIQNRIKASEEGLFTNVIVNYDGKQTPILSADYDIRYDKQKTQVIDAEIVARFKGVDYFTSEHQARNYGMSALRDNLRDMYKGSLLVMGDPSVKPHDFMYIQDDVVQMNGPAFVKAVTHHFSHETGFVTSIEPDAYVVNDDLNMLSFASWIASAGMGLLGTIKALGVARAANKRIRQSKTLAHLAASGKEQFSKLGERGIKILIDSMDNDIPEFKEYKRAFEEFYRLPRNADPAVKQKLIDRMNKAAEGMDKVVEGAKADYKNSKSWFNVFSKDRKAAKQTYANMKFLVRKNKAITGALKTGKGAGTALTAGRQVLRASLSATVVGALLDIVITVATESVFEAYSRFKEALQCVWMVPLQYKGKELTAGINGHQGMVVGDAPGKLDVILDSKAFEEDKADGEWGNTFAEVMNFFSGDGKKFSIEETSITGK